MPDLLPTVQSFLLRELEGLKREIIAFPDNSGPWMPRAGVANTAGTLALHCAGNIQHFIGARLGSTGYVRQRELEFSRRDIPRDELVAELDRAIEAVHGLDGKSLADLPPVFPDSFGGKQVSTDVMLVHLAVHLGYHLGQMDYHRRITTGDAKTVNAVAATELPTSS